MQPRVATLRRWTVLAKPLAPWESAASRLWPAHAARLHFYGRRTITEVWRVAFSRRDNRGFLYTATLSTCRRVGWAGRRCA